MNKNKNKEIKELRKFAALIFAVIGLLLAGYLLFGKSSDKMGADELLISRRYNRQIN